MNDRYIAFDVETPNRANDRMSAIGVTVIERGSIVEEFYSLVDPEVRFDPFNVQLTGITPKMAAAHPAFPRLWETLAPLMDGGVLIAHNAPFDLRVLSQCLSAYQIFWKPRVSYACTCTMGRACYPRLENHRLDTLCAHLGVALDHHLAASDAHACGKLLLDYLQSGLPVERYVRSYDLARRRTLPRA